MARNIILIMIIILSGIILIPNFTAAASNEGFEMGNFAGWTQEELHDSMAVIQSDCIGPSGIIVNPPYGQYMARLGTSSRAPIYSANLKGKNAISRTFQVTPENYILTWSYYICTYDGRRASFYGPGYWLMKVTTNQDGGTTTIYSRDGSSWGSEKSWGELKTFGWKTVSLDLSNYNGKSYIGQEVKLYFTAGEYTMSVYNTWAYFDSPQSSTSSGEEGGGESFPIFTALPSFFELFRG